MQMHKPVWALAAFVLILVAGCGRKLPPETRRVLLDGPSIELYSLGGKERAIRGMTPSTVFHQFQVLGSLSITDAATRRRLFDALETGVKENESIVSACFNPRHGIRVTHEGHIYDILICFECLKGYTYRDGTLIEDFLTSSSPMDAFNAPLEAAGIPLAEPTAVY